MPSLVGTPESTPQTPQCIQADLWWVRCRACVLWPGQVSGTPATPDGLGVAAARRSVDGRLSRAQAELALQEESVRRSERERRATLDQVAALERSLQATESELRASQVGRPGARGMGTCVPGRVPERHHGCPSSPETLQPWAVPVFASFYKGSSSATASQL